jgi:hypothetical protein
MNIIDEAEKFFSRPMYYGWDSKPVTIEQWINIVERQDRHVGDDYVRRGRHVYRVSTVLLGLNHGFSLDPDSPPIIFETMIFKDGDMGGEYTERYAYLAQAKAGHKRIVRMVRRIKPEKQKQLIHNGGKP